MNTVMMTMMFQTAIGGTDEYRDHDDVSDATYASILLQHAKTLWDFAINHPGIYSHSVPAASGFYRSAFTVLCLLTFSVLQFSAC